MKKIVLIASLIIGFSAGAQNLVVSDSTSILSAGDTITVSCTLNGTNYLTLFVKNQGVAGISAKCRKKEISVVGGSENTFCWGICVLPSVFQSPYGIMIDPDSTVDDFLGEYDAKGFAGTTIMMYTFFDESNVADSMNVFVKYVAQANSIGEVVQDKIELSNAYPNPADGYSMVTYKLPSKSSGNRFMIRDMLGNTVMDIEVFDKTGTIRIDADRLGNGVYFYTMFVNYKPFATRKLIVKH